MRTLDDVFARGHIVVLDRRRTAVTPNNRIVGDNFHHSINYRLGLLKPSAGASVEVVVFLTCVISAVGRSVIVPEYAGNADFLSLCDVVSSPVCACFCVAEIRRAEFANNDRSILFVYNCVHAVEELLERALVIFAPTALAGEFMVSFVVGSHGEKVGEISMDRKCNISRIFGYFNCSYSRNV